MADRLSDYRNIRGRSYRDKKGRFVKYSHIEELRRQEIQEDTFRLERENIWRQRVQSARLSHEIRTGKRLTGLRLEYNKKVDERLELFKRTPRDERTSKQWKQWKKDMSFVYGPDEDDWGDYD